MIVIRAPINSGFTKVDRRVFTLPKSKLSDGAKVLYGYLAGVQTGQDFSDKYIIKAMEISQDTLTRRKKELKNANLILTWQISPRVYILFVGCTGRYSTATHVKDNWFNRNDGLTGDLI